MDIPENATDPPDDSSGSSGSTLTGGAMVVSSAARLRGLAVNPAVRFPSTADLAAAFKPGLLTRLFG